MGNDSEGSSAGLFDDVDVNHNQPGPAAAKRNANLVKLIGGAAGMGLNRKENAIDACEHPMGMYASNAGKKEVDKVCKMIMPKLIQCHDYKKVAAQGGKSFWGCAIF